MAAIDNIYYHRRRKRLMDLIGDSCNYCGSKDNLQVDHIDPSIKSFNINQKLSLKNPDVLAEIQKCQLLCADCHIKKTSKENEGFTHGGYYAFQKIGCGCDVCEEGKRLWYDERNARRRMSSGPRGSYGRPSTHGEKLHYKRGCRCLECKAANAAYVRSLAER